MNDENRTTEKDLRLAAAATETIEQVWSRWGLPMFTVHRTYMPHDVEGIEVLDGNDKRLGLITLSSAENPAIIVTLDVFVEGIGIGTRLLFAAEDLFRQRGHDRVRISTTNDNTRALGLYVRRGYRLIKLHLDAMERVREAKPYIPERGIGGVPLCDMWELEKELK